MMMNAVAISVLNEEIALRFANARNDELMDIRLLSAGMTNSDIGQPEGF